MRPSLIVVAFLAVGCAFPMPSDSTDPDPPAPVWPPGPRMLRVDSTYDVPALPNLVLGKVAIADLNGDGRNDVAAIEQGGQRIVVFYQTSVGSLAAAQPIVASDLRLQGLATGDVNGDRRADLVVSGISISSQTGHHGRAYVYRQTGAGALDDPEIHTVSSSQVGDLAIGDVNGDGRDDIVVMTGWEVAPGEGRLSIRLQHVDGTLEPEVTYDHGSVVPTGQVHIADMNHDGRSDVVLQTGQSFSVIRQTSAGALSVALDSHTIPNKSDFSPFTVGIGDVNHDGWNDVLVPDPTNANLLVVWLQTSAGALQRGDPIVYGGSGTAIVIADVDGEGRNDIVVYGGQLVVMYQAADGRFPTVSYPGSSLRSASLTSGFGLAVGDVTGDQWVDAVAVAGGNRISVARNTPK